MRELSERRQDEEYADSVRESFTVYEETYRDGSLKNECWNTRNGYGNRSAAEAPEDPRTDE